MTIIPLVKYSHSLSSIKPFIIAPVGDWQEQILLGTDKMYAQHNYLINDLKSRNELNYSNYPFAKAFTKRQSLYLTITFPTEVVESSGRGGLSLTIGLEIDLGIFKYYIPCSFLMNYMCLLFSEILQLDLKKNGAELFLNKLNEDSDLESLKDSLIIFKDKLQASLYGIKKRRNYNTLFFFLKKLFLPPHNCPHLILCFEDTKKESIYNYLFTFFSFVDYKLEKTRYRKLKMQTESESFENYVIIAPCLPQNLSSFFVSDLKVINGLGWIGIE